MAVAHQNLPPPLLFFNGRNPHLTFRRPQLCVCSKKTRPLSLSATPQSIFLPYLQEQDQESTSPEEQEREPPQEEVYEEEDGRGEGERERERQDPIRRFFDSRLPTGDPPIEGKFSLQSNRRSSWHISSVVKDEAEDDDLEPDILGNEEETVSLNLDSKPVPDGIPGEILQIVKGLPENSSLGEFLKSFVGKITKKECTQVLELLGQEGLVNCSLYFYDWMRSQEPSLLTPRACSIVFPLLGREGMGDQLVTLFDNLPNKKQFRDVHVYNSALSGLMSSGRYSDALRVYEAIETNNIQPDHVTGTVMITVMRKSGRSAKDVWEFFERMNRKGVEWSSEGICALIKPFCDEGLKEEAFIILAEMEKKGISPGVTTYNTLMYACTKANQIEEAEGLLVELKSKGLKPTTATYNILMDAYSRRRQPDVVEKLLLEMKSMGLEPSVISYTCLINTYGQQREMSDMAANAFLKMRKAGIKPNSHSYTALIHAYSVDGWHEKAYKAFENMQREGIRPSIKTYTALLDACRRAGDTEMLLKIWKMMISEKIVGTRVTYNTLLDGFAKHGHYVEARDVISEFSNIGLQPTVMTYNMLMNAYARGGQDSKLPGLLKEMVALNLKPDSVTYKTMIYAYLRVRDFKSAFYYHKKMVKSRRLPDAKDYEKLRAILEAKAKIQNKSDRRAMHGIIGSYWKPKRQGKKDEFWKNKRRHTRTRRSDLR